MKTLRFALFPLLLTLFMVTPALAETKAAEADATDTVEEVSFAFKRLLFNNAGETVTIGSNLATFVVPEGFKYLDGRQAEYVMHDLFNNPPDPNNLGMIVPAACNDTIPDTWVITINYTNEGHVKDDDAKDINYDDLLKDMQKSVEESKEERRKQGYAVMTLLGWASPPYYDEKEKKLHWAKRFSVEGNEEETLNYNIRVLGREGVLELNAIGATTDLDDIKSHLNPVLAAVNFTDGNRYADFKEGTDKTAAYGIAGLITGGVLLKTGLLAKIGLIFLKFAKLIFVGAAALIGGIVKFFKGKSGNDTDTPAS